MKDMALSDDEQKDSYPVAIGDGKSNEPMYPYGLCLCLDESSLKKLGIKNLPEVGASMTITAKVQVKSISEYESMHNGERRSMDLQITAMEIVPSKKEVDVKKLYDSAEKSGG